MPYVVHLKRTLHQKPSISANAWLQVRSYCLPADRELWLDIRNRSFSETNARKWDASDFEREFLAKPWWQPDRMWFAEELSQRETPAVGTVTLAMRSVGDAARPVVHWLAVLPDYRRRGVGRLLMNVLEAHVWDLGYRDLCLETHESWKEAVMFYQALEYR